jgi:hypothetical protein
MSTDTIRPQRPDDEEAREAIRDACEAALDGEVAEQATLEEVTA